MSKIMLSIRASEMTKQQFDWLTAKWGTSQTETLTVIIDRVYQQETNKMRIRTYQDSLGHYRAVIDDRTGQTIGGVPNLNEYGFDTEADAITAAQDVVKDIMADEAKQDAPRE